VKAQTVILLRLFGYPAVRHCPFSRSSAQAEAMSGIAMMAMLLLAAQADSPQERPGEAAIQAPGYGPEVPAPVKKPIPPAADDGCATVQTSADQRQIVICAQRPQGYRLNP